MLNKHKLQRIAIATSALMAFGTTQLSANAETVTISGAITGPTCVLGQGTPGSGAITNYTVALNNVALSTITANASAGTPFDIKKTLDFSLNAAGGGVCQAFGTSATGWDIAIAPAKSGFLKTIGTGTFLGNMITAADGGTNAVVKLTGGVTTASNDINLNDTGTDVFVSAPALANAFKAQAGSSIQLGVQFAQPVANLKPNSGNYSSTLTVAVTYR